jgi:mono/diheme cytochrome c family protein
MVFMKTRYSGAFAIAALIGLSGCYVKHSKPYYVYAPDMHFSAALKAQEPGSMRPIPEGAIARGHRPYEIVTMEEASRNLNPLQRSKEVLQQGKQLYNSYCVACHGTYGEGDGLVVAQPNWPRPLYPRPPSLQSEKIRDYKDGQIFHVISMGQNSMPSYAEKLDEEERWAVIHYIRALYRAKHPIADDLKQAEGKVEENL